MPLHLQVRRHPGQHVFDYSFDQEEVWVGRASSVDIRLPDGSISLVHLSIRRRGDRYFVLDNGSTNGARLNDVPLKVGVPTELSIGATLEVGPFRLLVQGEPSTTTTTADDTASFARQMAREALGLVAPEHRPQFVVELGPQIGASWVLEAQRIGVVGRAEDCDLCLTDADVSRRHLEVKVELSSVFVRDLDSHHGARVNGEPLRDWRRVSTGDSIRLGQTLLRFLDPTEQYLRDLEAKEGDGEPGSEIALVQAPVEPTDAPLPSAKTPIPARPVNSKVPPGGPSDAFLLTIGVLVILTGAAAIFYFLI